MDHIRLRQISNMLLVLVLAPPAGQYGGEVGVDRHLEPLLLDELLLGGGREVRVVYLSESSLPEQIIIITIIIIIIIT